jgi:hypothetical protein
MACKLTTAQLRAMVAKIEATCASHENRPGTPHNIRELEKAQARLQSYCIELDRAEARDREAAPAPPQPAAILAQTADPEDPCNGEDIPTVTLPPSQATRRMAIVPTPALRTHTAPAGAAIQPGRRAGHDRRPYHTEPEFQEPAPAGLTAHPTPELIAFLRPLLEKYTTGAITRAVFDAQSAAYYERHPEQRQA